jgi:microsomal dipeptidase-like Zn-dependent dipeptidase
MPSNSSVSITSASRPTSTAGGGVIGWNDASETLNVTVELVRRGYSEAQIEKLWGGNLLRVMDEVQRVAREPPK